MKVCGMWYSYHGYDYYWEYMYVFPIAKKYSGIVGKDGE